MSKIGDGQKRQQYVKKTLNKEKSNSICRKHTQKKWWYAFYEHQHTVCFYQA